MRNAPPEKRSAQGRAENAPIVAFSSNDWSDIPSSTSQLMRQLARTRNVLYVDTLGIRTPRISRRDARRAVGKLRRSIGGVRLVERNLYVWSPVAVPLHGSRVARWLNAQILAMLTRRVMRRLGIRDPIVYAALPSALALVTRLPRSALVYHCVDDYREFTDAPREAYEVMEEGLLQLADLTVVSAPRLFELRQSHARNIVYLPHGVDIDSFERSLERDVALPDIDEIAKPVAGFVGRVGDWIDLDLILRCAREMPDWSFVVIGPTNVDLEPYAGLSNLVFLGPKPHGEIPHYIKRFSVGLLPFVDNDVSASVNPLKLYEYLAVGTPVVSTSSLNMSEFADVVDVASPMEFAVAIRRARESDAPERREARRMFVAGYSWDSIADRLIRALENTSAVGQGGRKE
jgi:glycosyltransferase involved in cell wall biosynthesis